MRVLPVAILTLAAILGATAAHAQCNEEDGYVFVFSQCQQQEAADPADLCQHAPGEEPEFVLFMSNVILDAAEDRSSLGSLFFYVAKEQHEVELNGTSSQCFATKEAAREHREVTVGRYRDNFENVVVKDVTFDSNAGSPGLTE